jgi:hypothetical protein
MFPISLKSQGKSQLGWLMLKQGVQLAHDFGLFQASRALPQRRWSVQSERVAAITAWGVYIMNSYDRKHPLDGMHG